MIEITLLIIFQICAAFVLFWAVGFLGHHTRGMGYMNFSDIEREGSYAYNLVLRIFAPGVFIVFLSIALYVLNAGVLVQNIWLVAVWYAVISVSVSVLLGRLIFANKILYVFTHLSSIAIAYYLYMFSISKGLLFVLPNPEDFRTELWIIIIGFFYVVLSNYNPDPAKYNERKKKHIISRYQILKKKYQHLLTEQFIENELLEKLLFSIMILEDMNRNTLFRFFENLFYPLGFVKTTGVMQINAPTKLSDEKSVTLAQRRINLLYEKYKNSLDNNYQIASKIAEEYNPSPEYMWDVVGILNELTSVDFLHTPNSRKSNNERNDFFPNIEDAKEYKDVLNLFEGLIDSAKDIIVAEKDKLKDEKN